MTMNDDGGRVLEDEREREREQRREEHLLEGDERERAAGP